MKPVDEHCRTQRLNFLFFLLRSSLSVQVAMKTGSSSIRGSCSTCKGQEKSQGKKYMIAKKRCFNCFQGNTILALCLCASPQTKKQTHFCLMLPSNKIQSLAKHTPVWTAALHVVCKHCKVQLSLLTICYSSTSLQNDAGDGAGRVNCYQHPSPCFFINSILFGRMSSTQTTPTICCKVHSLAIAEENT